LVIQAIKMKVSRVTKQETHTCGTSQFEKEFFITIEKIAAHFFFGRNNTI
jgi:hypothetical protein